MNPVKIDGANKVFGKPHEMTDEECGSLHVRVERHERFRVTLTSAWKPNAEELRALNAGAAVILTIHGVQHPPVSIGVAANEYK